MKSHPDIRPFGQESFLKMLEASPPSFPIPLKRNALDLYRLFLKSKNFSTWFQMKTSGLGREWRKRYLMVLSESNLSDWIGNGSSKRDHVECIDLLLRIRDELVIVLLT